MNLIEFIKHWNLEYPYDRFWRKKHGVAFGSKQHREMNFIDIAIDIYEDKIMQELDEEAIEARNLRELDEMTNTIGGIGIDENQGRRVAKMTKKEVDETYDNLDLTQFND